MAARESLESALKEFDGTILFVSHDRYFIRALAGKIWELENGKITQFTGSYDEFTAYKTAQKPTPTPTQKADERVPAPTQSNYYRSKEERAQDAKRRNRIKKIEDEISALEAEDCALNESLSTPDVTGNFALLTKTCARLEEIKTLLDALYEEYETLL